MSKAKKTIPNVTRGCDQHYRNKTPMPANGTRRTTGMDAYDHKVVKKAHNAGVAKSIRGQRNHEGGQRAEMEVARMFRDFGFDAVRTGHWNTELPLHRRGQFADVSVEELPVRVEVKYVKSICKTFDAWVDKNDAEAMVAGEEPVLAFRRHKRNWKAVVDLKELLRLLAIEREHEQKNGVTGMDLKMIPRVQEVYYQAADGKFKCSSMSKLRSAARKANGDYIDGRRKAAK